MIYRKMYKNDIVHSVLTRRTRKPCQSRARVGSWSDHCDALYLFFQGKGVDVGCRDGEGGGDVEARSRLGEKRRRLAVQVGDKALSSVRAEAERQCDDAKRDRGHAPPRAQLRHAPQDLIN